jgi:hypothetical protein
MDQNKKAKAKLIQSIPCDNKRYFIFLFYRSTLHIVCAYET